MPLLPIIYVLVLLLGLLGAESFRRLRRRNQEVRDLLEERERWLRERDSMSMELTWWRSAAHISDDIRALVDLRLAWRGKPPMDRRPQSGFEEVPLFLVAESFRRGSS